MSKSVRKLTFASMMTAFSVALLCIAGFLPTMSFSAAAAAGLFGAAVNIHCGLASAFSSFAAATLLSAIISPDKALVILYAVAFGLYPLLKSLMERPKGRIVRWALKLAYFNAVLLTLWFALRTYLFGDIPGSVTVFALTLFAGNAFFIVYDIAITNLIWFYIQKIAPRFKLPYS